MALEVDVGFESEHNFYTGLTQDISAGGLFVATAEVPPVGTRIELKFNLPGHPQALHVEAEVRWVRDDRATGSTRGMGLEFVNLPSEVAAVITGFIAKRESLYYDDALED